MKYLRFESKFIDKIISWEKKETWRLFDKFDIEVWDVVALVDGDNNKCVGFGKITHVDQKNIDSLVKEELLDHGYRDKKELILQFRKYYNRVINLNSEIKIIEFELIEDMDINYLWTEIYKIILRNNKVELDKKRETSLFRKVSILLITYVIASLVMYMIWDERFYINSIIPTIWFWLSTQGLWLLKKIWLKFINK